MRDEQRPLSIPSVPDRIVQAAVKIVLEPVFEAGMLDCSFGFRPGRSAHGALQVLIDECWRGRRWVVETDIASCLDSWSYCSFADFRVQKSPSWGAGISIRRPFLRPVQVRTARSSPRLTFCNTVWRETPSAWVA